MSQADVLIQSKAQRPREPGLQWLIRLQRKLEEGMYAEFAVAPYLLPFVLLKHKDGRCNSRLF